MWTGIWFLTNIVFVICAIAFLFAHRSVTEARRVEAPSAEVDKFVRRRSVLGVSTIVMFIVMASSFMMNMKING